MAFGDTVQSAQANGSGAATLAVSFSAATAGNLLVVGFGFSTAETWTTPSGWTLVHSVAAGSGNMSAAFYYKIAAGGETSVTGTVAGGAGTFRGAMAEFEGAFAATPLDVSAESEANISTVVASQTSGTTGATAQNDELAIGFFAADAASGVDGGRAYSNSFTEVIFASAVTNTGRAMATLAKKVLSATGTQTTTYTTTDGGDEMYGAIACFKKAASGAYTLTAATGSYALTGQNAGLLFGHLVTAAVGTYALTGQTAGLLFGHLLTAANGSYAVTGQAATLLAGRLLTASSGSFTLTGHDATLTYTPIGGYTLTAQTGSFAVTGQTAGLLVARLLTASPGAYVYTGNDAGVLFGHLLAAANGSHTVSGQAAGLIVARLLTAANGSYVLTGPNVTLLYSGATSPTDVDRIFFIEAEGRIFIIAADSRRFDVEIESRQFVASG